MASNFSQTGAGYIPFLDQIKAMMAKNNAMRQVQHITQQANTSFPGLLPDETLQNGKVPIVGGGQLPGASFFSTGRK